MIKKFDWALHHDVTVKSANKTMMLLQNLLISRCWNKFKASPQVNINIINLLGGRANIVDVDACKRLVSVLLLKALEKVELKNNGKAEGAMGLVMKGQGVRHLLS